MTKSEVVLIQNLETMKNMNGVHRIEIDTNKTYNRDPRNKIVYIITDADGKTFTFSVDKKGQARFEFSAIIANLLMVKAGLPSDVVDSNICYENKGAIRVMNMLMNWIDQTVEMTESETEGFNNMDYDECPDSFGGLSEV